MWERSRERCSLLQSCTTETWAVVACRPGRSLEYGFGQLDVGQSDVDLRVKANSFGAVPSKQSAALGLTRSISSYVRSVRRWSARKLVKGQRFDTLVSLQADCMTDSNAECCSPPGHTLVIPGAYMHGSPSFTLYTPRKTDRLHGAQNFWQAGVREAPIRLHHAKRAPCSIQPYRATSCTLSRAC